MVGVRFTTPLKPEKSHVYAVTNAHAVESYPIVRVNKAGGGSEPISLPLHAWKKDEKNDLAIVYVGTEIAKWDVNMIMCPDGFLTIKDAALLDIGLGSDVFMATRLLGHEGKDINQPILRFGTIARMDAVPVLNTKLTIHESKPFIQDSIFVECRSVPGHSGSAVIAVVGGLTEMRGDDPLEKSEKFRLLGITWCFFPDFNKTNTGIAGVVPAWKLKDLLERKDIVDYRKKHEREVVKQIQTGKRGNPYDAVPTSSPNDGQEGYASREDFLDVLDRVIKPSDPEES